jgi:hypothetical protein
MAAKRHWRVIPLHGLRPDGGCTCGRANCSPGNHGKHPADAGWQNTAPMSPADVQATWESGDRNLGVATGTLSGFFVIDIDIDSGGMESAKKLQAEYGTMPATVIAQTGSGGWHFYFKQPADFDVRNRQGSVLGPGIDIRGTGGQVVMPPSRSGKGPYRWAVSPDDVAIAEAPAWLLDLLRPVVEEKAAVYASEVPDRSGMTERERNRLDRYADNIWGAEIKRLQECSTAAKPGGQGYRGPAWNATTFEVTCTLLQLANSPWCELTEQRVYEAVKQYAPRDCGFTDAEVDKAFRSARQTVGSKARPLPVDRTPPATGGPVDPFEDPTGGTWAAGRPSASPGIQTPDGPGPAAPDATGEEDGRRGPSIATKLVCLGNARYTFGRSTEGDPFALPKDGPRIVRSLRGGSDSLRAELAHGYFASTGKAAPQGALTDAITTLTGAAEQTAPVPLALRVAEADGSSWLDLGDAIGRAVRLDKTGWSVVDVAPVLFRRTELTGPLPVPERGGTLAELFELVNVSPADQPVVAAVLLAGLLPDIPHPVTFLTGEQGVGKSSAQRILTSVLDASPVPLRKPPTDVESWTVAAAGSWVVGVDNVSHIPPWFSDSLCRAATGDGDVRRRYYTNGELHVFAFRRCVWLNGIDLTGIRDDLADRAVTVRLESLAGRRREDAALARQWATAHPRVLGALLDIAVRVLGALPTVRLDDPPRMIDFARVLAAVDSILGTDGLGRYRHLADDLAADAVSGDPVLAAIAATVLQPWEGTAAQLLTLLDTGRWTFEARPRDWPRDARAMGSVLRRRGPSLRQLGWTVDDLGRGGKAKAVRFRLLPPAGEAAA